LALDDFIYCSNQMIKNWSNKEDESEFSRDFLIDLKDLKILLEKELLDDHKKLVSNSIAKANKTNKRDGISSQTLNELFKV
jgi:hypothetical protein